MSTEHRYTYIYISAIIPSNKKTPAHVEDDSDHSTDTSDDTETSLREETATAEEMDCKCGSKSGTYNCSESVELFYS